MNLRQRAKQAYKGVVGFSLFLLSAWVWFVVLCFGGAYLLINGVRILAGDGCAYLVGGILCFLAAALIRKGL